MHIEGEITNADLRGLKEFMHLHGTSSGIVVTKDIFRKEEAEGHMILFILVWFFLFVV